MLTSVTLQNYKSFGEAVEIPLSPITVLVGANNSGKSNFLGFAGFLRRAVEDLLAAIDVEGGSRFLVHRPLGTPGTREAELRIAWTSTLGAYRSRLELRDEHLFQLDEVLEPRGGQAPWVRVNPGKADSFSDLSFGNQSMPMSLRPPFLGLRAVWTGATGQKERGPALSVAREVLNARYIRLDLPSLKSDSPVVFDPRMDASGRGLAAELGLWKGSDPDKAARLDAFLRGCLPELQSVLVKPAPREGFQRLWVRQKNGEEFDAHHLSDGVLCFIGLAMHAISAGPDSLMLVEEPEQSIHPLRIHQYVELLKTATATQNCQFIIATHSPVLLNEFRDDPESILLFNRGKNGTQVRRLSDDPALMASLDERDAGDPGVDLATPGLMLQDGFFNLGEQSDA